MGTGFLQPGPCVHAYAHGVLFCPGTGPGKELVHALSRVGEAVDPGCLDGRGGGNSRRLAGRPLELPGHAGGDVFRHGHGMYRLLPEPDSLHADGNEAVEAVQSKRPNLVILDVMLPNKSGFDILKDLRDSVDTREVPVLMLTARGQNKDRMLAEKLGVSRFMTKPFSNADILSAVQDLTR